MKVQAIATISLLWVSVSSLIPISTEAPCAYNAFGVSTCESPEIYLVDRNERQVYPDGIILIEDEVISKVSLVIASEEYMLRMAVDNVEHTKPFSVYYIVKVSEHQTGYTYEIDWKEITLSPTTAVAEFEIPLQFEEGIYELDVFVWDSLDNPKVVIAKFHIVNPVVKAITIETKDARYQWKEPNQILLNSTRKQVQRDNSTDDIYISEVIIESQGRRGGNYAGLEFRDEITVIVSAERPVYADIVYWDIKKQEWIIVKQVLSKEFKISAQVPKEVSDFNYKWGDFMLNPNDQPVRANMTTILTNNK